MGLPTPRQLENYSPYTPRTLELHSINLAASITPSNIIKSITATTTRSVRPTSHTGTTTFPSSTTTPSSPSSSSSTPSSPSSSSSTPSSPSSSSSTTPSSPSSSSSSPPSPPALAKSPESLVLSTPNFRPSQRYLRTYCGSHCPAPPVSPATASSPHDDRCLTCSPTVGARHWRPLRHVADRCPVFARFFLIAILLFSRCLLGAPRSLLQEPPVARRSDNGSEGWSADEPRRAEVSPSRSSDHGTTSSAERRCDRQVPLDFVFLQDASWGIYDELTRMRDVMPPFVEKLLGHFPESSFSLVAFSDIAMPDLGWHGWHPVDKCYDLLIPTTRDASAITDAMKKLRVHSGRDEKEGQLIALHHAAKAAAVEHQRGSPTTPLTARKPRPATAYGKDAPDQDGGDATERRKVIVLATDAPYHEAGDAQAMQRKHKSFRRDPDKKWYMPQYEYKVRRNDGDLNLSCEGPDIEDYPTIGQVASSLREADATAILFVSSRVRESYETLRRKLAAEGFYDTTIFEMKSSSEDLPVRGVEMIEMAVCGWTTTTTTTSTCTSTSTTTTTTTTTTTVTLTSTTTTSETTTTTTTTLPDPPRKTNAEGNEQPAGAKLSKGAIIGTTAGAAAAATAAVAAGVIVTSAAAPTATAGAASSALAGTAAAAVPSAAAPTSAAAIAAGAATLAAPATAAAVAVSGYAPTTCGSVHPHFEAFHVPECPANTVEPRTAFHPVGADDYYSVPANAPPD